MSAVLCPASVPETWPDLPQRPVCDADLELAADLALEGLCTATDPESRRVALARMLSAMRTRSPERIEQLERDRLARCGLEGARP